MKEEQVIRRNQRVWWQWGGVLLLWVWWPVGVLAMEIVSPTEGTRIEVGSPFFFQLRPDPGEEWIEVSAGLEVVPFNPLTGMFEVKGTIPKDAKLGSRTTTFTAVARDGREIDLSRTVTVVLPSTITVEAIGAGFNSAKKTFLQLARKPSGELVSSGTANDDELSVSAFYSDGVMRDAIDYSKVKYISSNEKVAIVIPPGQWEIEPGRIETKDALVRATGPGTTDIIVRYGEFTDRVTVKVKECPYTEGMKRCPR